MDLSKQFEGARKNSYDAQWKDIIPHIFKLDLHFSSSKCSNVLSRCLVSGSNSVECQYTKSWSYSDAVGFLTLISMTLVISAFCIPLASGKTLHNHSRQDLETALSNTKCAVREEILDIRKIHPTIRSDVKLRPPCVKLQRCSGCCDNDRHVCMPIEIYITEIDVSRQHTTGKLRVDYITLNFTEHAQCACLSPINPCIPRICAHDERWNVDRCRCESRCIPQECGPMQRWNRHRCRCECKQCHPDRTLLVRFEQDHSTCICACRRAHHSRNICKRKRAEFNPKSCTCIPSSNRRRWKRR